jgi:hypothetical protein
VPSSWSGRALRRPELDGLPFKLVKEYQNLSMPVNPPLEPRSSTEGRPMANEAAFQWDDPLLLDGELTEEERLVRDTARDYSR